MNAKRFLPKDELARVEEAVAAAEKKTSAELVCAIATESGRYDRAEGVGGLIFSLLGLGVAQVAWLWGAGEMGWGTMDPAPLAWQALSVAIGFVVGSVLTSYVHPLRSLLTTKREIDSEVRRSAWNVFALRGVASTMGESGLLLYVSLAERRVLVLGDGGVMKAIGQQGLDELRDLAIGKLRDDLRAATFIETIERAAEMLSDKMPPEGDNPDELSNHVGIFHPRP